jgi:Protein of unknown function (DUF2946)
MVRRLLLALLLLALSAPAVAMGGHCTAPTDAATMHHADHGDAHHHPAPAQAERGDCIGCVLPDLGILAAPKAQVPAMLVGTPPERPALALARSRPDTPPPRS